MQVTARQRQILALVADGLSGKQIARRLEISERTVDAHLQRLFDRHGVRTRAALVARWAAAQATQAGPRAYAPRPA